MPNFNTLRNPFSSTRRAQQNTTQNQTNTAQRRSRSPEARASQQTTTTAPPTYRPQTYQPSGAPQADTSLPPSYNDTAAPAAYHPAMPRHLASQIESQVGRPSTYSPSQASNANSESARISVGNFFSVKLPSVGQGLRQDARDLVETTRDIEGLGLSAALQSVLSDFGHTLDQPHIDALNANPEDHRAEVEKFIAIALRDNGN